MRRGSAARQTATGPTPRSEGSPVDFAPSAKAQDYLDRLQAFMDERVFPAEAEYERYRAEKGRDDHTLPPVVEELRPRRGPAGCGTSSCRTCQG